MSKQITMQTRPKAKPNADQWVEERSSASEPKPTFKPKRLTIDIDPNLHTQLKVHCAMQGVDIAELVRQLIQTELSKPS